MYDYLLQAEYSRDDRRFNLEESESFSNWTSYQIEWIVLIVADFDKSLVISIVNQKDKLILGYLVIL
jgi:hypothetical protein